MRLFPTIEAVSKLKSCVAPSSLLAFGWGDHLLGQVLGPLQGFGAGDVHLPIDLGDPALGTSIFGCFHGNLEMFVRLLWFFKWDFRGVMGF